MRDDRSSHVSDARAFPIDAVRRRFPAIANAGGFLFFDNAAGDQIPADVLDAVNDHHVARNVQRGGPVRQPPGVDAKIDRARATRAAADTAPGPTTHTIPSTA